ncbi:MAG TPA: PP2C family protein-serine/threonine phosphatase, partial [Solirubrobacteraceae bacterium]|nr:PP2C family protein-serine/threonine phosphatase [Solirubrobacteraceae bacterium]
VGVMAAPTAAAKPAGKKHGGTSEHKAVDIAPGQMKKAAAATVSALAALVRQAAERSATAEAKPKRNVVKPSKEARKAAKRAAATAAAPTPPAVIAPAAVTAPAIPSPGAAPPAVASPTPSTQTPRTTSDSAATAGRRERSASRGSTATPRTSSRPAAAADPPRAAASTAATSPAARRERPATREDATATDAADSPLTRTVVRVLEVVPAQLRAALAALAGLGLLLGAAAAVQTVRRRRLERQRRTLLADVGVLQSALLPQLPERIGGAHVTAAYRPAEGLAAGGDFYDAFELPGGRTGVLVGDVAGHGRAVVPLTALVRYNVRAYLEAGLSPRSTVHVAANVLAPHLGELQVTLVVAIFDPGTGRLTYACAGHAPPLLLGDTRAPVTTCSSPPLGAGGATGRRQTTIPFAPGAVACLYTDGLDEAPLTYGRLGRDGVAEELRAVGAQPQAGDLIARIVRRSQRQPDDMAACIVTALPGGAASWSLRLEELEVDRAMLSSGWAQRFLVACGVEPARGSRALREAHAIIARSGTAVVEVRVGEALADVRVTPPPAITLPIAGRSVESRTAEAA